MGTVRTAIRSAAFSRGTAAEVLARANRLLYSESRTMVTALFGIIDRANATFRYAVAGHPPPLILKSDGSVRDLALGGPPLGIIPELTLDDRCEPLRPDETLLLYTDGIIEFAHDAIAGERRLHDCAARWARGGRLGGVAGLAREVLGQSKPGDDIAMLAVTLLPDDVIDVTVPAEPRHSSILRETVREFAEGCKLAKSRVDDLILSVGEAVNNAILHAYEERGGTVRVRAKREASKIVVEVLDSGCWRAAQAHPRSAQLDENGRGLLLMRSLVDAEVDAGVGGTRVTLTVQ